MITDEAEGIKELTEQVFALTKDTPAPLTRRVFGIPAGTAPPRNMVIRNNRITEARETKNLWMYSTSGKLMSLAEARRVFIAEYDAVAMIHDPYRFSGLLAAALHKSHPIVEAGGFWVQYGERERPYAEDDGIDPALLKPLSHAEQAECRLVFVTHAPIHQLFIDLEVPDLVSCCRMVQDSEIPN
jgi:hypothetical protein